jgi:hypothetical protein
VPTRLPPQAEALEQVPEPPPVLELPPEPVLEPPEPVLPPEPTAPPLLELPPDPDVLPAPGLQAPRGTTNASPNAKAIAGTATRVFIEGYCFGTACLVRKADADLRHVDFCRVR